MTSDRIYLDHNATTPLRPEAREAIIDALDVTGNPSSVHGEGRATRAIVEQAREQVANLAGAVSGDIVFTSGATESNNWVVQSAPVETVIVSAVEHASVLEACDRARSDVTVLSVKPNGMVCLVLLERVLEEKAKRNGHRALVSVQAANSETGVVQPVREVAAVARKYGALVHCDAVQLAGKLPLSFTDIGLDFMSLSAHKIGGPKGVGALVLREGQQLQSMLLGGGQENRRRAGTENVHDIAGFGAAATVATRELDRYFQLAHLRDRLEQDVIARTETGTIVAGQTQRLPNTSCLVFEGRKAEITVIGLDLAGVAVSAGSACSSGKVRRSHVLEAMGLDEHRAECSIRISFGWNSSKLDVERALEAFSKVGLLNEESAAAA